MASRSTSKQDRCDITAFAFGQLGGSGAIKSPALIDLLDGLDVEFARCEECREFVCCEHWRITKQRFEVVQLAGSCLRLVGDGIQDGTDASSRSHGPEPEDILPVAFEIGDGYRALLHDTSIEQASCVDLRALACSKTPRSIFAHLCLLIQIGVRNSCRGLAPSTLEEE